ncbi:MAG TPA: protein kinase, partial [Pseudonocardiaceae bacterium]|nr:protein kinase [Pseudonocardiaceae bacterium]
SAGTLVGESAVPTAIADYAVVRLLGTGNHGRYYLARPPARLGIADEYVAVKVFTAPTTERAYELSVRELRAFAAVDSPYLVRVYDAVLTDSFALACEYLPLGSLAQPARPLTRAEVLSAVRHAALAAHALHEAGLVHGDIKPANILLTPEGAKLTDLGLARFLTPGSTLTGMTQMESVEFVDPALLRGERPSRATEVWALGASLHKVLTGNGLYGELPGTSPLLAIRKVMSSDPALSGSLAPEESALLNDCLAPPEHRLATAAALAERLLRLKS